MSDLIKIRLAELNDIDKIALLFDEYRQFYQQAPDFTYAKQFITNRIQNHESVILVAENTEPNLMGFCQMYPTFCSVAAAPILVLYDLFVIETTRKLGAGRALMHAAADYAKINHYTRLDLSTAKNNLKAQALYESLGWVRDEQFYYYSISV